MAKAPSQPSTAKPKAAAVASKPKPATKSSAAPKAAAKPAAKAAPKTSARPVVKVAPTAAAKPAIDKHLHDARGTFGTRLRRAGLTASEIADVLGWDEKRVQHLLATYIDRDAIVMGLAERIRRNEGTEA